MKRRLIHFSITLFVLIGLAACGGAEVQTEPALTPAPNSTEVPIPTTEPPTDMPAPSATSVPTETPVPPSPTAVPPTAVPPSPTPLPPTATAEPTALPEFLVTQQEDVVGEWISSEYHDELVLRSSGGLQLIYEGRLYGQGTYYIEGDQMVIDSQFCEKWEAGIAGSRTELPCTATYTVFATKDGDTVVNLRFEVIDDPYTFRVPAMEGGIWQRTEE